MEKTELTGKYWKLIRLNGKPVETGEREAFLSFTKQKKTGFLVTWQLQYV
jgi:hypothetical protein